MPPKRKLASAPETDVSNSNVHESPYSKRQRRVTSNQTEAAQSIFNALKEFEDETGHLVCETFLKLPSKRYNSDYYEKIVDPVDMNKIAQRIRMEEYRDVEILTTDVQLMVSNAKKYYEEQSQEYTDACNLWEAYLNIKNRLLQENKTSASPGNVKNSRKVLSDASDSGKATPTVKTTRQHRRSSFVQNADLTPAEMKEVFDSIIAQKDDKGRVMSTLFMNLPDQTNVGYYEIIKDPIDFTTIGKRLEKQDYRTLADLDTDMMLLIKNAKSYNEPSSQVYDDANCFKKLFRDKVADLERRKKPEMAGIKTSARIKHRKSWSKNTDDDEKLRSEELDRHEAAITICGPDEFTVMLYNDLVNHRNVHGHTIADPFLRLPNKRHYPTYYDEITNPISLKMIRKKILNNKYKGCEDLHGDLKLLLDNAMFFNVGTSQIHKDAAALLKLINSRLPEYIAKEEEVEKVEESDDSTSAEGQPDANQEAHDAAAPAEEDVKVKVEQAVGDGSTGEASVDKDDSGAQKLPRSRKKKPKKTRGKMLQEYLQQLYDAVFAGETEDGREMIALFVEKPSRKDYPDYYKLVLEPIDMRTIEKKIRTGKYQHVDDMLEDFRLMFNNARHYNEPGSEVYSDANQLERILSDKISELGPFDRTEISETATSLADDSFLKKEKSIGGRLDRLFCQVRDHVDISQRTICDIFAHLPTKQELPDYYQIIKKPMEMDRIQQKMQGGQYVKLVEMLQDMVLMFENACVYNEPGSLIYKDALILQKVAVEKYYEIEGEEAIPSVELLVHEMLTSLFMSVVTHQDENGRFYSESLFVSQHEDSKEAEKTLMAIKKNLQNHRYKRLDVFQEDFFDVLEETRSKHRTDSEVYEDAVELHKFFIKIRDELCKNGETLVSPALSFTHKTLENELDAERKTKLPQEAKEDEEMSAEERKKREKMQSSSASDAMSFEGAHYAAGDFVYVENQEVPSLPHIVCIEKLFTEEEGERRQMLYGTWFFRPEATFHMASKKFLRKEVFKSDYYNMVPVSLIRGRCHVMLIKDYFKFKPVGLADDDVYVCESRYSSRVKSFKRIKYLPLPHNSTELVPREIPMPVIRISSVYSDGQRRKQAEGGEEWDDEKSRGMISSEIDDKWPTDEIAKTRENMKTDMQNPHNEATYYTQYYTQGMWIKLGDCVYVKQASDRQKKIARVERLWTDKEGNVWFHGPWFVGPADTEHEPTRMFFKKELLLSSAEETVKMCDVTGKCVVLSCKDYSSCRPTQVPEHDVYLYECRYSSSDRLIKKIKGMKRYTPTHKVVEDEYYYFKKSLMMDIEVSPQLKRLVDDELALRQHELDNPPPSPTTPAKASAEAGGNPQMFSPQQAPFAVATGPQQQAYPQIAYPPHYQPQFASGAQLLAAQPGGPMVVASAHFPPNHFASPPPAQAAGYPLSPQFHATPPPGHPQAEGKSAPARPETPASGKKKRGSGHSTGYILFASDFHPKARAKHPDLPFGDISKIVGEEWRHLDEEKKREYEELAKEQSAKAEAEGRIAPKKKKKSKKDADDASASSTPVAGTTPTNPTQQPPVSATKMGASPYPVGAAYSALPQQQAPYTTPNVPRMGVVGAGHYMQAPHQSTPVSYQHAPTGLHAQQQAVHPGMVQSQAGGTHVRKRGPLFVQPPPKAQRVMHSEAYLRYIEGLENGHSSISNWERTLTVKENDVTMTKEEEAKLPAHWLGNGARRHGSVKSALWALRDLLLKDAFTMRDNFA